jgi:DNA-binding CsgD family transcriptional regulator
LRVRCSELTRDYPFGVARNLFGPKLIRAERISRARLLQGPAALAEPVFDNGSAADEFAVIHGLYWLTVNLAEQKPLVILIDDLPWADGSSQRFFGYLAERVEDLGVAIVATIRSGDPVSETALVSHVVEAATTPILRPTALSEKGIRSLLACTAPTADITDGQVECVRRHTGGIPFFVVAVAEALRSDEAVTLTAPDSVRRQLARRLARLDADARDLAQASAVLGDDSSLDAASQLACLDADRAVGAWARLAAAYILGATEPLVFSHGIVREGIYHLIAPEIRMSLHAGAARVLAQLDAEPEVVAEHLLLSANTREPWALQALHDSGRAAARRGAHAAALTYLRRAVVADDSGDLSAQVLVDLGLSEAAAGEATSLKRFEKALELLRDPGERADALYLLGETQYRFGRFAEARATFHRGAQLFAADNPEAGCRFLGGEWSAEAHLTPTKPVPKDPIGTDGPGTRAILAARALQDSLSSPPVDRMAGLAVRALADGLLLGEQGAQGPSVHLATLALLYCGRVTEAKGAADATLSDAVERGSQLAYAESSMIRGLVLYTRGRVADAAVDAQAAADCFLQSGHVYGQFALALLVHCMIERGELDEAAQIFVRAEAQLKPTPVIRAYVCVASARLHLHRRENVSAQRDLDELRESMQILVDFNPSVLPWRSLAGIAAHRAGDDERCRQLFDEEMALAESFEAPIAIGVTLRRRASTEATQRAVKSLNQALNILQGTEASLQVARVHASLGRELRRAGDRLAAREHLTTALDLAYRCGATALERTVRQELAAAGGRPRRPAVTGIESLTPTETRIAHLAALGVVNRDIAEQLFVSRNTVSWHLRNVYRKLGVDSRDGLMDGLALVPPIQNH